MDRRHGKRPLPSEASEEKEREPEYHSNYYDPCWSQPDYLAAMAGSDFTHQLIGTNVQDINPPMVQSASTTTSSVVSDESTVVKEEPDPSSQPSQDQGTKLAHNFGISNCFTL